MRLLVIAGVTALAALAAVATADPSQPALRLPGLAAPGDLVGVPAGDVVLVRQLIADPGAGALAQSRIIYLNHTGITVTVGTNDSRTNRSTLVDKPRTIPPWNTTAAKWSATVACMTDMFARFAVVVTDRDPGNVPH